MLQESCLCAGSGFICGAVVLTYIKRCLEFSLSVIYQAWSNGTPFLYYGEGMGVCLLLMTELVRYDRSRIAKRHGSHTYFGAGWAHDILRFALERAVDDAGSLFSFGLVGWNVYERGGDALLEPCIYRCLFLSSQFGGWKRCGASGSGVWL